MTSHNINWPTTDIGWCEWYKRLDEKYGTQKSVSLLHHDERCPFHNERINR